MIIIDDRAPLPSIDLDRESSSRHGDSPNEAYLPPSGALHVARMSNSPEISKSKGRQPTKSDSRGNLGDSNSRANGALKRESASEIVSAARKSVNAQLSQDWTAAESSTGASSRKRAPNSSHSELTVPPLNVSFRVKGAPNSLDQGG
jgi:hypothetical protein